MKKLVSILIFAGTALLATAQDSLRFPPTPLRNATGQLACYWQNGKHATGWTVEFQLPKMRDWDDRPAESVMIHTSAGDFIGRYPVCVPSAGETQRIAALRKSLKEAEAKLSADEYVDRMAIRDAALFLSIANGQMAWVRHIPH